MAHSKLTRFGLVFVLVMMVVLTACGSDDDKDDTKVFHVGVLSGSDIFNTAIDGFKAGLTDAEFVEGKTIEYDIQYAGGDPAKMKSISEKFVADKVDLIFVTTNNATLAVQTATADTTIPVIFTLVIGPIDAGLVESLAQPGGHITGIQNPLDISIGKRIEFWLEIDPEAKQLWVPYDPNYPTNNIILPVLEEIAPQLGIELIMSSVSSPAGVVATINNFEANDVVPIDAVIILPDLTIQADESWNAILAYSQAHGLPILANTLAQVEQGALLSFLTDNEATGRQAAHLAEQVFNGINAGNLPVETADLFLTVNLPAAEALGLTVPDLVLGRAATILR
ncbi:MAG: ABC transporter substrate-binding protein [Anaerolineae bacterium]|nr:ABC transporter substrate-binding protein [Anaerolineae bacterium]